MAGLPVFGRLAGVGGHVLPRMRAVDRDDVLVAKGYRFLDRDQQFLLPENMGDWLPASDPVWLLISVVAGLDTAGLHAKRRTGGAGRAGYGPDMLLTLLIWAWAQGMRSSRVIERLCHRDVAFRIICAGDAPDHVTISRFRAEAAEVCEELFAQVLVLCARLGMGQLGVVAVDSVKIASDASLAANRSEDGLRKAAAEQAEIDQAKARQVAAAAAAEHAATDAAEDALFGPDRRGDEVPEDLVDPRSRAGRIKEAIAQLKADSAVGGGDREVLAERQRQRQRGPTGQAAGPAGGLPRSGSAGPATPDRPAAGGDPGRGAHRESGCPKGPGKSQNRRLAVPALSGWAYTGAGRGQCACQAGPSRLGPGDRRTSRTAGPG